MRKNRKRFSPLEGLLHNHKEAKASLRDLRGEVMLANIPGFLRLETGMSGMEHPEAWKGR